MLKRSITYTDFNDEEQTETYYFNLSQTELIELETQYEGGFAGFLQRVIETRDVKGLIEQFKKLVLMSYGQRSDDGKRFIKNDQLREEFAQTAAYDALFTELSTDAGAAAKFAEGIIPAKILEASKQQDKPQLPPPPPVNNLTDL